MIDKQTANLIGALCLAITDAQLTAMTKASGLSQSDVAAILTLGPNPDISVSDASKILDLTHSAAVRLADRLECHGLIVRRRQAGHREVALRLTDKGHRLREKIARAKAEVLGGALSQLSSGELSEFEQSVRTLLEHLTVSRTSADRLCRLCDEEVCPVENCPVECRARELERIS